MDKEEIKLMINNLDKRMAELKDLYSTEIDPGKKDEIGEEMRFIMVQTNGLLKRIGASEQEMYLI